MKKLLSGIALGAFLAAAPAMAADLPARMPVKAPEPVYTMYNWSGFYIGGHAGWGRGEADLTVPAGTTTVSRDTDGFLGGGQVGINWQTGQWVFGLEGSVSFLSKDNTDACTFGVAAITACSAEMKHFWRAGGRVGFAAGQTGNWLIYATGGFARAQFETSLTIAGVTISDTVHHAGWYAGGGVEWGVAPNFVIGVEGYFARLGDETVGTGAFTRNVDLDVAVVQARASYKFNWGGPVVARY
jgi:outer membrane immunogenic protein